MNKINEKTIIRAAIYIRVSTEEQAKHGYSLNSQTERLIDFCKQNHYKIIETYADEGKSARSKLNSRKELLRLIEDVKQKKFDRIVFWRLDRWFRNVADYYKIQEILESNNVDWQCSDEEYDTFTSNGRLHLNIKLSIAQNESDQTGDRIRFNFSNMIKNNRAIQGSHCMPLGYKVSGGEKNKHVIKDEMTSHIVIDMFDYFKTFNSIRKTLIYINNKYNLSIAYDSMRHYLKNELYTGTYKNVDNYCEAYITKEEFKENQLRIKRNAKSTNKKYEYIFSGLIKCYNCGCNMSGATHVTIQKKYNRRYSTHAYRCNKACNSKLCTNLSPILENILEDYLINHIISKAKQYIIESENIIKKEEVKTIDINKIQAKLNKLADLYIEDKISKEKYELEYEKYKNELDTAKKIPQKRNVEKLKSLIDTDLIANYNKLTNEYKRAFWITYIDYIERDKDLNFIVHFK